MIIDPKYVGTQISTLRKSKNLTQAALAARLHISFQAISKWERGETLPDITTLAALASVLETSVDNLLHGGQKAAKFKGKCAAKDVAQAINCLECIGFLIGRDNGFYHMIIDSLDEKMGNDTHAMLADDFMREGLVAEVIIQGMIADYYYDLTEVRAQFKHEKWYNTVCEYAKRFEML